MVDNIEPSTVTGLTKTGEQSLCATPGDLLSCRPGTPVGLEHQAGVPREVANVLQIAERCDRS